MYQPVDYKLVEKLREAFPAEFRGQLFMEWKPKKNTYEFAYYFMHDGVGMRCDGEVVEELFSQPEYYNWTDEDISAFVSQVAFQVHGGLMTWGSDEDDS